MHRFCCIVVRPLVLALLLVVAPLAAQAPASPHARVGVLALGMAPTAPPVDALKKMLAALGWVEGQNLSVDYRFAGGNPDRLPALAAELARSGVDLIVTDGTPPSLAARQATRTIPIVMASSGDPVAAGLVDSLARPGGNVTGLAMEREDLRGKRLQLVKDVLPQVRRVAFLWHMNGPLSEQAMRETERTARSMGLQLLTFEVRVPEEIDATLAAVAAARPDALMTAAETMLGDVHRRILDFAMQSRLPGFYPEPHFAAAGGMVAYGPDLADTLRRTARLIDKVLRGAKPADLPIEAPTRFVMVVNLRTAKALGLELPQVVLLRADQVIE